MARYGDENRASPSQVYASIHTVLAQAVGFEMLFQEGKNAVGKTNTSVDGVRATVL